MKISDEFLESIKSYEQLALTLVGHFAQRACYLVIGHSYYQLKHYEKADQAFARAHQLSAEPHPYALPALMSKAHCHFSKDEFLEVTRLLESVQDVEAQNLHGRACQKLSELEHGELNTETLSPWC